MLWGLWLASPPRQQLVAGRLTQAEAQLIQQQALRGRQNTNCTLKSFFKQLLEILGFSFNTFLYPPLNNYASNTTITSPYCAVRIVKGGGTHIKPIRSLIR